MAAEIFAGLSAVKTAFDLAKGLKDINDAATRNAAVIELQEQILTAQQTQSTLVARIEQLEKELANFHAWDAQKKRYQLKDFGGGTFAYEMKQSETVDEPIHRICPTCYEKGQRSILQTDGRNAFKQELATCKSCNAKFKFGNRQEPNLQSRANTDFDVWS